MIERIQALAKQAFPDLQATRQHLHANPELSFHEFETSAYIQRRLDDLGVAYETGYANTGIIAHLGQDNNGKHLALRGDMDALPIQELNEVSYASKVPGVMHACGHDVHTTCLLGALAILKEVEQDLPGKITFIFQPGEEKLPGGASLMIKDGLLEKHNPQRIIAQHVFPELEVGQVGFRSGMYMASCDEVFITVKGKGGHGAMPQQNIDPILISAHLITALQQLVSRKCPPEIPAVLSFGKIEGLGATNVIPDEVKLEGTFRTMNEKWRSEAHKHIQTIAETLCTSMGASADVHIAKGYPFLVNDDASTSFARNCAEQYLGAENVKDLPLRMTGEDFAYFSQEIPACFYRLGTRNTEKGITAAVHNARFDIDENALEIGAGLMAWMAYESVR